jgi:hypothetical protein
VARLSSYFAILPEGLSDISATMFHGRSVHFAWQYLIDADRRSEFIRLRGYQNRIDSHPILHQPNLASFARNGQRLGHRPIKGFRRLRAA